MSATQLEVKKTVLATGSSDNGEVHKQVRQNEDNSVWKSIRLRKKYLHGAELETQMLFWKFQGILNKLPRFSSPPYPEKIDTLYYQIKTLKINNETRLAGITDMIYEQAINEHHYMYLAAYGAVCVELLKKIKVPVGDGNFVNFRALIINKCQIEFEDNKIDEKVLHLETEHAECTDATKNKELKLMLEAEKRRVRMRLVGNVNFIGEMYKNKMLTSKIMDYCMKYLINKVDDVNLERFCKLLESIGGHVEHEVHSQQLDIIFKKMQDIVDCKSNNIGKRVRFMLQDIIDLRKKKCSKDIEEKEIEVEPIDLLASIKYKPRLNTGNIKICRITNTFAGNSRNSQFQQVYPKLITRTANATKTAPQRLKTHKGRLEECKLYGQQLAEKLMTLEESDRITLMNNIDDLVYKTLQASV